MFFKKRVRKNLAILTGKHLRACDFIKMRLQHRWFPVNIEKFLRITLFYRILLMATSELPPKDFVF